MTQAFRDLIKKFRQMDPESQQNVIDRVSNRDKDLGKYLRKIRDMQQGSKKIDKLAQDILDKI